MGLSPRPGHIDPMEYDILLELATRIGGTYMGWAYETEGAPTSNTGARRQSKSDKLCGLWIQARQVRFAGLKRS